MFMQKSVHILSSLLIGLTVMACKPGNEEVRPSAVTVAMSSLVDEQNVSVLPSAKSERFIFQTTDAGNTWQDISMGLPHEVRDRRLFVSGQEVILKAEKGLFQAPVNVSSPAWTEKVILDQQISYVFPGLNALYGYNPSTGFFKEVQGSGIWMPLGNTLGGKDIHDFVETSDGVIVIASPCGILKSIDGCKTWKKVFVDSWVSDIMVRDGLMYAGGANGMWRSDDGGDHWEMIGRDMGDVYQLTQIDSGLVAIFTGDPSAPKGSKNQVMVSYNKGMTWESMDQNLHEGKYIYDFEKVGDYLFCSKDTGVYRSADNGKTWKLVRPVKDNERIELAVSGKTVYAVLSWGGC